ncbi:MAG: acetyl-CoA carboxylase biotin carboxyl carrier protein subunit [Clostridia bacterium]|nr:acetyl-CoA carboxylase biotin carboxyl carrier protein subunit [Clostridia bacterium]
MKYIVTLNGKNYEVEVEKTDAVITAVTDAAAPAAAPAPVAAPAPAAPAAPAASAEGTKVNSPMPGTILSVSAAPGKAVKTGEVLMILEAMKMENEIVAPCDGTVKQILVQKGSTVETDAVLAVIG